MGHLGISAWVSRHQQQYYYRHCQNFAFALEILV